MLRIERLVNLIAALLETRKPMTAEEIRERIAGYDQESFEAFRRTFERDKETLRSMGIPLELKPLEWSESADGYIIPKEKYYLPDMGLEPDELAALKLAADVLLGTKSDAAAGFLKLALGSPAAPTGGPRLVWGADLDVDEADLAALYAALSARRTVRFQYSAAAGETTVRRVETYALVHRGGAWYVVGRDVDRDDVRTFKNARISSVGQLDSSYDIPDAFDAASHIREAWEIGDRPEQAVVRFDRGMRWWAEQNMPSFDREEAPGGALHVRMSVANVDALVSWALQFADSVEILEPQEARARLLERVEPWAEETA